MFYDKNNRLLKDGDIILFDDGREFLFSDSWNNTFLLNKDYPPIRAGNLASFINSWDYKFTNAVYVMNEKENH